MKASSALKIYLGGLLCGRGQSKLSLTIINEGSCREIVFLNEEQQKIKNI